MTAPAGRAATGGTDEQATDVATDHECAWDEWHCPGLPRYRRNLRLWLCGEHFALVEQTDAHLTPPSARTPLTEGPTR